MKKGFTLLELSIVIIIIGLIIGGITVGADLIRAAEISSIVSDANKYQIAVDTFRLKYKSLPGDMPDASDYWPNCDANPENCNGDGNGRIELHLVWPHLSHAQLIAGTYSIIIGEHFIGQNVPGASINNSGWTMSTGVNIYSHSEDRHYLSLGSIEPTSGRAIGGVLTTTEAKQLDDKFDDGEAAYGKLYVTNYSVNGYNHPSGCVNGGALFATATGISWDLTNDDTANCRLFFHIE